MNQRSRKLRATSLHLFKRGRESASGIDLGVGVIAGVGEKNVSRRCSSLTRRSPNSTVELFSDKTSVQRNRGFGCGAGFDFSKEEVTQLAILGNSTVDIRREYALTQLQTLCFRREGFFPSRVQN
ncbi:hypothetical protein U1Q18_006333 [Sarracenia purpurea var. burkii]